MPRLVVVLSGAVPVDAATGHSAIDAKTRRALVELSARWPGEVVLLAAPAPAALGAEGDWREDRTYPFDVRFAAELAAAARRLVGPGDLAMVPLSPGPLEQHRDILHRSVLLAEFSPRDRRLDELRGASDVVTRARIQVGSRRWGWRWRRHVLGARGVLCNGIPVYEHCRRVRPDAHLFFDSGLTRDLLAVRAAPTEGPFTLAFSGRLVDAKGPQYAVRAAAVLARRGVPCRLLVMGDGELLPELSTAAGPETEFLGFVPFRDEWVRIVRDEVDLMVLPHVQADPSGTYLEAAGLGVPTLGFDNACLTSLVREVGLGWAVPMFDAVALADRVQDLMAARSELAAAGRRGHEFMHGHVLEIETAARVDAMLRWL